jgi:hypothetical protein
MFFDKESGVGVRETVWVPARGMTGRSVRKRQQPPSLERQVVMLHRWTGSVNGPAIGSESQVVGVGSHQTILLARRTEEGMEADDLLCSRNAWEEKGGLVVLLLAERSR